MGLGNFLLIAGSICDFTALAFCSQITVGVLGALTMFFNLWVTSFYFQEKVGKLEYIATLLIISGCIVCVIASSQETKIVHTVGQVMVLYRTIPSTIFLATIGVVIFFLRLIVKFWNHADHKKLHSFCHPASAGFAGSLGVLFGKYIAEILHGILKYSEIKTAFSYLVNDIETILVVVFLFGSFYLHLRWLNQGLAANEGDVLVIIPTSQVCWVIGSVSGGAVVFREMHHMTMYRNITFIVGVLMAITGVLILTRRKIKNFPITGDQDV